MWQKTCMERAGKAHLRSVNSTDFKGHWRSANKRKAGSGYSRFGYGGWRGLQLVFYVESGCRVLPLSRAFSAEEEGADVIDAGVWLRSMIPVTPKRERLSPTSFRQTGATQNRRGRPPQVRAGFSGPCCRHKQQAALLIFQIHPVFCFLSKASRLELALCLR